MSGKVVETPLMKQYAEMKRSYPDAVLLFRVGDFYETFSDDAVVASSILGITLTRRANGAAQYVELAGFPYHALDVYLPRLVKAGKRVAICEQLEDPKLAKKLVRRGITELVTPGVSVDDTLLNNRENNFLAGVHCGQDGVYGVAFLDISTGEFMCSAGTSDYVDKLLTGVGPKELLVERGRRKDVELWLSDRYFMFELDDWVYTLDAARERLLKQFQTCSLKGFGVDCMDNAVVAAGSLLYYLDQTKHTRTGHITALSRIDEERFVRLDRFTIRNLELTESMCEDGRSLIDYVDRCVTAQGARLLRRWLHFPLRDVGLINERLDVVECFVAHSGQCDELRRLLEGMCDLERIVSKVSVGRVSPRELVLLKDSLRLLEPVAGLCSGLGCDALCREVGGVDLCREVVERIEATLCDDAPQLLSRGGFVRGGVDAELDELRCIASSGKDYLNSIVEREVERTGIGSLKIGFNNVFGYYIEVRNTHKDKVPADWVRRQTLVSAERYVSAELKEYEQKILGAQQRIDEIEQRIFGELVLMVNGFTERIQADSLAVARVDVLSSMGVVAVDFDYHRPVVDDSLAIDIVDGRHPVIERRLAAGDPYVANSLHLDNDGQQVMMITGPNMSGKSALLRQCALIVLMAQCGWFVPARSARIGVVDKIFTRVGASDNISSGESTFMVEMNEAAAILNNMSERSLILFDELGRGTSTYDGISIAWAIVEHIHENSVCHPKTLFATHYHELNEMERSFSRVVNYHVSVQEVDGKVIFVRRLERGGSEHSFGIHVARLAGMPRAVVDRAEGVLRQLECGEREVSRVDVSRVVGGVSGCQLSIFELDDPLLAQIRDRILGLDINNLTPLEALGVLNDLKGLLTGR